MKKSAIIICALLASAAAATAQEAPDSAFVSIETNQGAEIGIDGKMSSTNFMTAKVPVGINTVTVVVGTQFQREFLCDVKPGDDNKFQFLLDGTLNVTAKPSNAYIYVDGQRVGRGNAIVSNIVGLHNVKVDTDDEKYNYQAFTVNIRPDGREDRNVELVKLPPPLRLFTHLTWGVPNDLGVMVGLCSRFGGYIRFATDFKISPFDCNFETSPDPLHHYTDPEKRTSYITGGGMARLHDNVYIYLGGGYGARYAEYNRGGFGANGVMVDGGLILRWNMLSINAGYSRMVTADGWDKAKFAELVIGIGVNFKL